MTAAERARMAWTECTHDVIAICQPCMTQALLAHEAEVVEKCVQIARDVEGGCIEDGPEAALAIANEIVRRFDRGREKGRL